MLLRRSEKSRINLLFRLNSVLFYAYLLLVHWFQEESLINSRSREDLVLPPVTWEEYFSDAPLPNDIGKPKVIETKVQKFRATLWLCEDYPLEVILIEQTARFCSMNLIN